MFARDTFSEQIGSIMLNHKNSIWIMTPESIPRILESGSVLNQLQQNYWMFSKILWKYCRNILYFMQLISQIIYSHFDLLDIKIEWQIRPKSMTHTMVLLFICTLSGTKNKKYFAPDFEFVLVQDCWRLVSDWFWIGIWVIFQFPKMSLIVFFIPDFPEKVLGTFYKYT